MKINNKNISNNLNNVNSVEEKEMLMTRECQPSLTAFENQLIHTQLDIVAGVAVIFFK
jgi:hypothetical protein